MILLSLLSLLFSKLMFSCLYWLTLFFLYFYVLFVQLFEHLNWKSKEENCGKIILPSSRLQEFKVTSHNSQVLSLFYQGSCIFYFLGLKTLIWLCNKLCILRSISMCTYVKCCGLVLLWNLFVIWRLGCLILCVIYKYIGSLSKHL